TADPMPPQPRSLPATERGRTRRREGLGSSLWSCWWSKSPPGQNLMQGPVAGYEGGAHAGDVRLPDLRPGEERLLRYAIDLGSEVKSSDRGAPEQLVAPWSSGTRSGRDWRLI